MIGKMEKYDWQKEVILIAEDDEHNFLLLNKVLSRTGAKICHARNGKEAFDLLTQNKNITLAILDLIMPVMNGLDIVEKCKAIAPDVLYVAYTADVVRFDQKICLEAGFSAYIAKPVLPVKFLSLLHNALVMRSHLTGK